MNMIRTIMVAAGIFAAVFPLAGTAAQAANGQAREAIVAVASPHAFPVMLERLERAIASNGMGLVARASASAGAAARGVKIPGKSVLMVFRPYAVPALDAVALELGPVFRKIIDDAVAP